MGVGTLVEITGVTSGGYEYTGHTILTCVLLVGVGWIVNTYIAMHLSSYILFGEKYPTKAELSLQEYLKVAMLSGILAVLYDLFVDPVAVALKIWVWAEEGPWFGVPTLNFIGWFLIIFLNVYAYYSLMTNKSEFARKMVIAIFYAIFNSIIVIGIMNLCQFLGVK